MPSKTTNAFFVSLGFNALAIAAAIMSPDPVTSWTHRVASVYFAGVMFNKLIEVLSVACTPRDTFTPFGYLDDDPERGGIEYPTVTAIIVAYLPNEREIILETLEHYDRIEYPRDKFNVVLAYNSPTEMEIMKRIDEFAATRPHLRIVRVADSRSKSENLNYVLDNLELEGIISIFDTDHHPCLNAFDKAARRIVTDGYDFVQGKCRIRNEKHNTVTKLVTFDYEIMYSINHKARRVVWGLGIFGGTNGHWRAEVIRKVRFDKGMLTEDIDASLRAMMMGYRGVYDDTIVSTEVAPTTHRALFHQRLRWAQGWFQVTLRYCFPILASCNVTTREKLGLLAMLVYREFYPYVHTIITPVVLWNIRRWAFDGESIIGATLLAIAILSNPLTMAVVTSERREIVFENTSSAIGCVLWGYLYNILSIQVSLISHFREAMRFNDWVVTPR